MVDFTIKWTLALARLGMQIALGRVRRKTSPAAVAYFVSTYF